MSEQDISKMTSIELREHLKELQVHCGKIGYLLTMKGQHVASNCMDDAEYGVRKTISTWNHAITW